MADFTSMQDLTSDGFRNRVVQTGPDSFEAPKFIVRSPSAARAVYNKLRANHLKRIQLYKEIEGLIAGNPPYNPQELIEAGLQHIANYNDMSARAVLKRAALGYFNLLYNSEYLVTFVLRIDDPEAPAWALKMSKNWHEVVKEHWSSFIININSLIWQLVKFGISPLLFPDERDPRWNVVELHRFFIPDQTQSDLEKLTTVCVETEFTVQYLWETYLMFKDKGNEKGDAGPWNLFSLGSLLVMLGNTMVKDATSPLDIFDLERKIYSGDISWDRLYNDSVRIVSFFQKEYGDEEDPEGKISHYMFHRYLDSNQTDTSPEQNFLFFQEGQYKSMQEAVTIFTKSPGEYTIHANKGVGHEIFSVAQAKIMLGCSVLDMAKWASTVFIKSPSLNTKDADQIRFFPGVPTNLGSAEFVENTMGANINEVVGAVNYLDNQIQYNITYSGSDSASPDPDQGSLSPAQTKLLAYREFSVLKNDILHFYNTMDGVFQNMTDKIWHSKEGYPAHNISKIWKERCVADGVPAAIFEMKSQEDGKLPRQVQVFATRAAGAGSQVAQLMGLQELQTIAGSFGPREEKFYKQQYVSATIGPEFVKSYVPDDDTADEQAGGASLAGVENAIMQAAKPPIFSPDNEHRSHFTVHMQLAGQIIQSLQTNEMQPIEADSIFEVLMPHTAQHLQFIMKNPFSQQFAGPAKEQYDQVQKYATLNKKNANSQMKAQLQQQQAQQQQQQQVMDDQQLKNFQAQNDEQRKNFKMNAQIQRQETAGQAKEKALDDKTKFEAVNTRKKIELEAQNKAVQTLLTNHSEQEVAADPKAAIIKSIGQTPVPSDIEGSKVVQPRKQ
jgi:hypothetical protein